MIRLAVPADAAGIARVHVDSWRSSYKGIVPDSHLAGLQVAAREKLWRDRLEAGEKFPLLYVAQSETGAVIGFAAAGPERDGIPGFEAEIYALYLLPSVMRQGIGRALLTTCARQLAAEPYQSLLVWVLKDNHPARRFYEALGGQWVSEKTITIGETDLLEVSYGWPDIHTLFAD